MKCTEVKKKLVDLLAGECPEEKKIRYHLMNCPWCAREREELSILDNFLDLLKPEKAPPDLLDSIMRAVDKIERDRTSTCHKLVKTYNRKGLVTPPPGWR